LKNAKIILNIIIYSFVITSVLLFANTGYINKYIVALMQCIIVALIAITMVLKIAKLQVKDYLSPGIFFMLFISAYYIFNILNYLIAISLYGDEPNEIAMVGWINIISLLSIICGYLVVRKKDNYWSKYIWNGNIDNTISYFIIAFLLIVSLVASNKLYLGYNLLFDSVSIQNMRIAYSAESSGLIWLGIKQLYHVAGISLLLLFKFNKKRTAFVKKILLLLLILSSLFFFSLYGGRWLPFSLLLFLVLLRNKFKAKINVNALIIGSLSLIILSSGYAAYRYNSLFNRKMETRDLIDSYFRQSSGENAELARTLTYFSRGEMQKVLNADLMAHGIPTPIFNLLFDRSKEEFFYYPSFGSYLARTQNRVTAGGLRISLFGELFLAYGYVGLMIGGLFIGIILKYLDRFYLSNNPVKWYISIFAIIQLIYIYLIGLPQVLAAIQLTVLACFFILLIINKKPS